MQELTLLTPGKKFKIVQLGNGDEPLFFERANEFHFRQLMYKHLTDVCDVLHCHLTADRIELILKFYDEDQIPDRFRGKLYMPLANLLNAYAKAINKRYGRKGSLFKRRFDRELIDN